MKGDIDGSLGCRREGDNNDTFVSLSSNMILYADNRSYDVAMQLSLSAQEKRTQRDRKEQEEHMLQEFENLLVQVKQMPNYSVLIEWGSLGSFVTLSSGIQNFHISRGSITLL